MKRYYLITYEVRDGENEYQDFYTLVIADPISRPQDVARDYLTQYWGDSSDDPKHGTSEDPRWKDDEHYWDPSMTRLVRVKDIKPLTEEEYSVLNRLLVACDITADTIGRRIKLKP